MITPKYARTLARYNHWMNDKVYAACESLNDQERKADRGAFFGSIHSTLNHLLWGDGMWLGRFTNNTAQAWPLPTVAAGVDLHASWPSLKAARSELDAALIAWAETLDAQWLTTDFNWYSGITKATRSKPAWLLVTHLFNHQTHHRGQVTTLLSQQGIDVGVTDLMMMPGDV
ncbi:DinB family protein [uncultured Oxalicibacterium sp.]|uniref:DinB family protein n=1 Tax=uncultured Oxalicibacterium sp. TaxID=1168540 RepID=UPI0025CDB5A0|nr:DinB family protein [uncultured Oxalicibacterium sp.]